MDSVTRGSMGIRQGRRLAAACLAAILAYPALGQSEPVEQGPPATPPPTPQPEQSPPIEPADPSVVEGLRGRPNDSDPIRSSHVGREVGVTVPGLEGSDFRISPPTLLPEGTFLTPRRGTVLRAGNGEWYVVFHPDERGTSPPPMALLPSPVLEEIEAAAGSAEAEASGRLTVRIAGQVFVYHRRNLLLPQAWSVAHTAPPAQVGAATPTAVRSEVISRPGGADAAARALDPSVEDLIAELQSATDAPRALDHQTLVRSAQPGVEEEGMASHTARAPQFVVRRKARVVRMGGAWTAVFESGTHDAGSAFDVPMVLMPGQSLMRIEGVAGARGDQALFELSGRVVRYRGRALLVPTFYRIVQTGEIGPRP